MNKKILGIALVLPVLCLALAFISGAGRISVKAEESTPEPLLTMVEGAGIRVAAPNGLRFMAKVNDEDALKATQEYGMYLCPTALLTDGVFPANIADKVAPSTGPTDSQPIVRCVMGGTALNKDDIDEDNELGKVLRYSIVKIKDSHIDREFSAMAFWKSDNAEHVTEQTSRSISYVARHAKRDPNEPAMKNDAAKQYIEGILSDSNDVLFTAGTVKDETYHHSGKFSRKVADVSTTKSLQLKLDRNSEGNADIDMLVFYAKAANTDVTINGNAVATGDFKKIVIKNPVISETNTIGLTFTGSGTLWLDDVKLCKCVVNADDENLTGALKCNWGANSGPTRSDSQHYGGDTHSICQTLPSEGQGLELQIMKDIDASGCDSIELSVYHQYNADDDKQCTFKNMLDESVLSLTSGTWVDISIPLNGANTKNGIKFQLASPGWRKDTFPTDFYISSIYCTGLVKKEFDAGECVLDYETEGNAAKITPLWHHNTPAVVNDTDFHGKKVAALKVAGGTGEGGRLMYYQFEGTNIDVSGRETLEFYIYNPNDCVCLFGYMGLLGVQNKNIDLIPKEWTKISTEIGNATTIDSADDNDTTGRFAIGYKSPGPGTVDPKYDETIFYISPIYIKDEAPSNP